MISAILNRKLVKDRTWYDMYHEVLTDDNPEIALQEVDESTHLSLVKIIDCTRLLEFCLSEAFIKSARILIHHGVQLDHDTACQLYLERNTNACDGIEREN